MEFFYTIELNLKLCKIKINLIFSHGEKFVLGHQPGSFSHRRPTIQQLNTKATIQYNAFPHLLCAVVKTPALACVSDCFVSYAGGLDSISHCKSSTEKLVTSAGTFCTIHALMNAVRSAKKRLYKTRLRHSNHSKSD